MVSRTKRLLPPEHGHPYVVQYAGMIVQIGSMYIAVSQRYPVLRRRALRVYRIAVSEWRPPSQEVSPV